MTTILNGSIGGLIVALVGSAAARLVRRDRSTPVPAVESVTGGRVTASRRLRVLSQLGYGSVAGGGLVALDLVVVDGLGVPPTTGEALTLAVLWSGLLFVTALTVSRFVRRLPFDRSARRELVAYHLVYGPGLGVWIRLTWIT